MIQNPFSGAAALQTMAQMAQYNPLANAGQRLGDISQLNARDELAGMMQNNGGNVNQSMAPTAMMANPNAMKLFTGQQDLQRKDRGLDQYDRRLDQEDTAEKGRNTRSSNTLNGTVGSKYYIDPETPMGKLAIKNGIPTGNSNYGTFNALSNALLQGEGGTVALTAAQKKTTWENFKASPGFDDLSEEKKLEAHTSVMRDGIVPTIYTGQEKGTIWGTNDVKKLEFPKVEGVTDSKPTPGGGLNLKDLIL